MEEKDIKAILFLLTATSGGVVVTCFSKYARDIFFFLLVTFSAMAQDYDVNFISREWYRGTTQGFEVSLVDVFAISLLVSSFLFPRRGEKRFYWPASLGLMLVFFLFTIFCTAISDPKLFGYFALSKMVRGMLIFVATALYVRSERELRWFILALAAAVCYEGYVALSQRYLYGIHRVFGTLFAPNSLSMYYCLTAPVFVAVITADVPRYLKIISGAAIALAFLGVVLTISRAGVVTIMAVLLGATLATMTFKVTLKKVVLAVVVMIGITAIMAKSWQTLGARFAEATLEEEYKHGSQGRGYYLRIAVAIVKERWFGVGPNNWSFWVTNKYGPMFGYRFSPYPSENAEPKFEVEDGANVDDPQAAPAHSLGALTLGEMGFGGLMIFSLLWLRWFQMGASFLLPRIPALTRRLAVGLFFGTGGIFLQSFTEWVFYQTPLYFTFHIMMGVLASLYYLKKRAKREQARLRRENEADEFWPAPQPQIAN